MEYLKNRYLKKNICVYIVLPLINTKSIDYSRNIVNIQSNINANKCKAHSNTLELNSVFSPYLAH